MSGFVLGLSKKGCRGGTNIEGLGYFVEKKISTFFWVRVIGQKYIKIFPQQDMTIYTPIESPCRV